MPATGNGRRANGSSTANAANEAKGCFSVWPEIKLAMVAFVCLTKAWFSTPAGHLGPNGCLTQCARPVSGNRKYRCGSGTVKYSAARNGGTPSNPGLSRVGARWARNSGRSVESLQCRRPAADIRDYSFQGPEPDWAPLAIEPPSVCKNARIGPNSTPVRPNVQCPSLFVGVGVLATHPTLRLLLACTSALKSWPETSLQRRGSARRGVHGCSRPIAHCNSSWPVS